MEGVDRPVDGLGGMFRVSVLPKAVARSQELQTGRAVAGLYCTCGDWRRLAAVHWPRALLARIKGITSEIGHTYRSDSRKSRNCICFRRRDITPLFYNRGGNLESNLRYFGRTGGTKYLLALDAAI